MKKIYPALMLFLIMVGFSCEQPPIQNAFVKVDNGKFVLNGKPYYYFGANFWHGAYLGANLVDGDQDRLLRELDLLKEHKITNLRVMASSELSELEMSVKPSFISEPGTYNERLLAGLDYLLSEMAKRNMKAILVLNNYWQWSGGMAQYVSWNRGIEVIDPDVSGDWDGFQNQSAAFYHDSICNLQYRNYITMLVNRTNTITGEIYKNDPTIMSWQLANEPRPAPDAAQNEHNAKAFITWVESTAKYIHSIAPNHLVSSGNEGTQGCRGSEEIFIRSHQSEHIDYLTFHIWPKNWGWFDATEPEKTFERALKNTEDYFAKHIGIARKLNKPIVLEEFGLERDRGAFSPESATGYRDKYLSIMFSSVVDSAKAGSPMAGLNFWAWGGEAAAFHDDYIWREGDSFMGDPPQEPQGLNSVFSTDSSTLAVFKKYNRQLEELVQ